VEGDSITQGKDADGRDEELGHVSDQWWPSKEQGDKNLTCVCKGLYLDHLLVFNSVEAWNHSSGQLFIEEKNATLGGIMGCDGRFRGRYSKGTMTLENIVVMKRPNKMRWKKYIRSVMDP
jgi:hypothetical protein